MNHKDTENRLLIAGLGNLLMRDDGVGVHAIRALQQDPPPGAELLEVGTAVLDALPSLERASRILALDAIQAGDRPGTIYAFTGDDMQRLPLGSLHELDLLHALRLHAPTVQPELIILGVEPCELTFSMELSPSVAAALPRLLTLARSLATQWTASPMPRASLHRLLAETSVR